MVTGSVDEPLEGELLGAAAQSRGFETARMGEAVMAAVLGRSPKPTQLGRYVVLDIVGSGAMGDVYRAYDPQMQREVALKRLRVSGDDVGRQRSREQVLVEARSMAALSHPNVVGVYDVHLHDDEVFLAMELVSGETLLHWLGAGRPWRETVSAFVAAGHGLVAAHAAGVVHRDFKPANTLVGDDGRICVTDFGLAQFFEARGRDHGPQRELAGTPMYMAPEQFAGAGASPAADQYAWCSALWEALAGQSPFGGDVSTLSADKAAGPPVWPDVRGVPDAVGAALCRGLAPDPTARWASMSVLLEVVGPCLAPRRRRAGFWGAGVLLAAAAAIVGGTRGDPTLACADATGGIATVWGPEQRGRIVRTLRAGESEFAPATANYAAARLDAWAAAWTGAQIAACRDTHVVRSQSAVALDRRTACLVAVKEHGAAVVAAVTQVEAVVVHEVLSGLAWPSRCSARDSQGPLGRAANDESLGEALAQGRRDHALDLALAGVDEALQAGQVDAAEAYVRAAWGLERAVEVGDAHRRIRLLRVTARLRQQQGRRAEQHEALDSAWAEQRQLLAADPVVTAQIRMALAESMPPDTDPAHAHGHAAAAVQSARQALGVTHPWVQRLAARASALGGPGALH